MVSRHASPAKSSPILTRADGAICAVLVLMILAVYWQTREFGFVNFDDDFIVYQNKHVLAGLSAENARWTLTAGIGKDCPDADYWRPISLMSHMLDVSLFGLKSGAHHLASVMLHTLTAVSLFLVLRALTARFWCSAFVAALFAVHPLHVESVAWVAERKDVLSGLFFVLTLGAYHHYVRSGLRWISYGLVLLLGSLAMMSKPMLVTLPCILLLLDFWPLKRLSPCTGGRLLLEKTPLFAMAALVAALTLNNHGCANDEFWKTVPRMYLAGNAVSSYIIYIKQTLWPVGLTCFYSHPMRELAVVDVVTSVAGLSAIFFVVWRKRRDFSIVVGWLWYLGMLVPVIGLFTQAGDQAHADRYMYLAMIGLSLMFVWPLADWAEKSRSRSAVLGSGAVIALVALMITAHAQVSHWRDPLSLWSHAVECHPADAALHANLGSSLLAANRTQEAATCYERALALNPLHAQARLNLGLLLLRSGRYNEAAVHLEKAVDCDPKSADAHVGLGLAQLQKGETRQAIRHFQDAADIHPNVAACYNLGNAQLQAGQGTDAFESFLRALEANPNHVDSHFSVGMIYGNQGKHRAAKEHYQQALASDPNHLPSLNNLAWLLATSKEASLRDGVMAVKLIEHALQLPGGSQIHLLHALAAAQAETGQYPQAVATARQAIQLATQQNAPAFVAQLQKELGAYLASTPWRE